MGFRTDLKLSENPKIHAQFDEFYKKQFNATTIKRFHKDKNAQYDYKTDVVITTKEGIRFSIDEKLRRPYLMQRAEYPMETWSNHPDNETSQPKRGWFYTSLATTIVFGTLKDLETLEIAYFFWFNLTPALRSFIKNYGVPEKVVSTYPSQQTNMTTNKWVHYRHFCKFGGNYTEDQLMVGDF